MKKNILLLAIALISAPFTFAQSLWNADPAHSNARFSVEHLGLAFVDGEFTSMQGSVTTKSDDDFNQAVFSFSIDVNSIHTRVEDRDNHLKSEDFFHVEKYPTMVLSDAVLTHKRKNNYTLTGNLTIRGVTQKITFDVVQNNGIITDPWGLTRAGFTAKTTINRKDFNINYGNKLPSGIDDVASQVDIVVNIEIVKEEE